VAIVGGRIGGVATANALLQRDMDVRLYEQALALTEVGAGVAIQPNGVRMLRRLGLGDGLQAGGAGNCPSGARVTYGPISSTSPTASCAR
jgi:salicylate hydroxylase